MAQVNIDIAKEASVQAVNAKVGASSDTASSTPTTLFAGIKGLIAWFTGTWTAVRASYVDTINTNTATNNTASKTGTLSQKESYGISLLENATFGLSALKTAIAVGGVTSVKSVQRGIVRSPVGGKSFTVSISTINPSKSFVLIHSSVYNQTNSFNGAISELTTNSFTLEVCFEYNSSVNVLTSWQVIEFY